MMGGEVSEVRLVRGDCVDAMRAMEPESVDAVVCDPPYNLSFMGRTWDRFDGEGVDPTFLAWFSGFVDGEGCFSVHRKVVQGHEVFDCQFSIALRSDDRPILERIQRTLGIGTLSNRASHQDSGRNPQARYSVSAKAELLLLRDVLRTFPLRAKKATDFEVWSQALDEWVGHERGEWDKMARLREVLMANREYKSEGVRVDPFQMWCFRWGREALRMLRPGGHLLAFGGTRSHHRLMAGLEDAGFEIRDTVCWLYGSGFPKSLDVSKAIDKAAGAEREAVGSKLGLPGYSLAPDQGRERTWDGGSQNPEGECAVTVPVTDEAARWSGWGTALKPAHEPVVVARKPLVGTVSANVQRFGTGALNIDGCRVGYEGGGTLASNPSLRESVRGGNGGHVIATESESREMVPDPLGRWPANVMLVHLDGCVLVGLREVESDGHFPAARPGGVEIGTTGHVGQEGLAESYTRGEFVEEWECVEGCPVRVLNEQTGDRPGFAGGGARGAGSRSDYVGGERHERALSAQTFGDSGGASRFFDCATASRSEREAGLDGFVARRSDDEFLDAKRVRECVVCGSRTKPPGPNPDPWPACGHGGWEWVPTRSFEKSSEIRTTGRGLGNTMARCPEHDASLPSGSNTYACGCALAWDEAKNEGRRSSVANVHPTVKPIDVMRWLVRLVCPPGGLVLDPFMGSGTTGIACVLEGFDFVGVEKYPREGEEGDPDYFGIAEARIGFWREHGEDGLRIVRERDALERGGERRRQEAVDAGQMSLL